jgi:hypothetical protein
MRHLNIINIVLKHNIEYKSEKKRECSSPAVSKDVSTNLFDLIASEDRNKLMMSDLDAREALGDRVVLNSEGPLIPMMAARIRSGTGVVPNSGGPLIPMVARKRSDHEAGSITGTGMSL